MSYTAPLDAWLQALVASTRPEARRQLARRVAQQLRQRQIERIRAQQNPDGSGFEPRKPQPPSFRDKKGRVRRLMFDRLATAKYLRVSATPAAATVEITGRSARIARVHQFGLEDTVNRRGLRVRYPIRELLGFGRNDVDEVAATVLDHIDPA